ncbi:MAG: 30S ribosomal protein S9 [Minisyncoccia bacterium]
MPRKQSSKKTQQETTQKYIEAIGRRKTSVARVRLLMPETVKSNYKILINNKPLEEFFKEKKYITTVLAPLKLVNKFFNFSIKTVGGGITGQAEAIRLGISRCLLSVDPKLRPALKGAGFLTRDPRMVERKHPGKRKARRPQQWRKR